MKARVCFGIVVAGASLLLMLLCRPTLAVAAEKPMTEILDDEYRVQHEQLSNDLRRLAWFQKVASETFNREALVTQQDRDPTDIVIRRTSALLTDLQRTAPKDDLQPLAEAFAALESKASQVSTTDAPDRRALYDKACTLRRKIALANPLLDFTSILFAKHHRARYDHMCDQYFGFNALPGGSIFVLEDAFSSSPHARDLLASATAESGRLKGRTLAGGSFLQPQLSYDAKQIVFSYTQCERSGQRWSPQQSYHAFRVNADGSQLVQLTDGSWNDLHPSWLADGQIVFISERRGGFGRCHARPVPLYTLHSMDAEGGNLARLSHHESNEWHPSVSNDGMIIYSRWDYIDRGHNQAHHAWITTPDGRDARAVNGNFKTRHDDNPDMELNVMAIPGSRRYVATAAPHHGQAFGSLIIIDPSVRDDDAMGPLKRLTPDAGFVETGEGGQQIYGTAWPLGENYYLCVYDRGGGKYGIYLIDAFGNRELLYWDPQIACLGPVPLKPRPAPPVIPAVGEPARLVTNPTYHKVGAEHPLDAQSPGMREMGIVGLMDVYDSLYPFPPGEKIEALRIVQVLPKSTEQHHQPQIGYGCETSARAVLGTVPVEEDGSAHFYLPPGKEVFFQALDGRGLAVQSMRSATYVRAGEKLVCAGCHNRRERVSPAAVKQRGLALRRTPSDIRPEVEGSHPLSYPRLVQPVLDKHCVECHAKKAGQAKVIDLAAGDWQKDQYHWYASYRNLYPYAFHFGAKFHPGYDGWTSARTVPGKFGAKASKLIELLDSRTPEGGHYDVKLSPTEFRRITLWLDCNSDFFGAYEDTGAQARGEIVKPSLE